MFYLTALAAAFLPALLSVYLVWQVKTTDYRNGAASALNIAKLIANDFDNSFNHIDSLLLSVGRQYVDGVEEKQEKSRLAQRVQDKIGDIPFVARIFVVDATGRIVEGGGASKGGGDASVRPYFKRAAEGDRGLIFEGPIKGADGWVIVLSRRMETKKGDFLGVVAATIPVESFEKRFEAVDLFRHGVLVFRNMQGQQIARYSLETNEHGITGDATISADLKAIVRDHPELDHTVYQTLAPQDNVQRFYAYQKLSRAPLFLLVGQPKDILDQSWRRLAIELGLLCLAAMMVSLWIARRLHASAVSLDNEKRFLEQRVADRTRELEANNRELVASEANAKAAKDRLAETTARLEEAQRVAGIGYWVRNLQTGEGQWSDELFRIFGRDPTSGKASEHGDSAQYLTPESRVKFNAAVELAREAGVPFEIDVEILPWEGGRRWATLRGDTAVDATGARILTGTIQDITERVRASEEIKRLNADLEQRVALRTAELVEARSKAEAASQAKSAFLANMSHEIRTPMNTILGATHLLRKELEQGRHRDRLAQIDRAAQHLLGLIDDILSLSKIESGLMVLEQRDFELGELLGDVASLIGPAAQAKGLRVSTDADDMPVRLSGDVTRLRQALLNYANNALKFTESGFIALRASLIDERDDGSVFARFEVQDSGIGIEPDVLPRLFTVFEQADVSTSRKYGGTGLGLAITRRLAEAMGGQAGADSKPGAGSVFWFTARLKKSAGAGEKTERPSPADAVEPSGARTNCRVLFVEDNDINREVAGELLRSEGLIVETARNGLEALEKARASMFDLILMDVQMPVMNGLEATREIRKLPGCGFRRSRPCIPI
jgi:signal transduction histidine kinase